MPKTETILQVFVASPGDVTEERGVLEEIIRELNITWADTFGIRLNLFRWETHAAPGFGDDAQDVINEQIPVSYDIFIGIMWTRFGTPTQRAGSGTEEEFWVAYDRHKEDPNSVEIMFYFKNAPVPPANLDPDQLRAISDFRSRLGDLGGLYFQFNSIDEFRNSTRLHLSRAVQKWTKRLKESAAKQPVTTQQEIVDTHKVEPVEDEEGFIDLIESANDSMSSVTAVLTSMSEATRKLGEKFQERAEEANKLSTPGGSPNLKAAKRVTANAARDLEDFVTRMNVEIPLYSDSFTTAMDSFGRAAALTSDFGIDNSDDLQDARNNVAGFRSAMTESHGQIQDFRGVIEGLPRMTTVFNRARRNAIATLDKLLDELNASNRQASDVENLLSELIVENSLSELIEQYKTNDQP